MACGAMERDGESKGGKAPGKTGGKSGAKAANQPAARKGVVTHWKELLLEAV